ncbi:Fe2+-enterobactin ABC transporter substrate-binding protein [Agromyces archimandritae]|uniref:Fe2+-enterobactin ABC transporter substrate-binding protein n=1 Tax=Agromyces archimandritae TaxID=2781962 RepID=A0A975IP63_9MICO|nr:Fe2+-enterobactin ABC transporter substrate-binding protein [Agromyces archimandritae]QTX04939.1 Fe2+-enterobactin ABC transporter substrate-binding protein [Agromyces archimandritae]
MTASSLTRTRLAGIAALAVAGIVALAGCSSSAAEPKADDDTTASAGWPRTFENADGTETEIPAQPERILSTSVSVTGTLLTIDAPVVASSGAANGAFFAQWADIADERGVAPLWGAGSFDPESVIAEDPDLIVVSTTGADSVVDRLEALQDIAPTIVVDYGGQTWQELAARLGEATGLEAEAEAAVADFDALVSETADAIEIPAGTANIVSFNGPGQDNPIARIGGAHADLLSALGFEIEDPDVAWHTQPQERADFVFAPYEKLTELAGETTFILSADDETARAGFAADPVLANVPSVAAGQVYGLGANSFRMDSFSAAEIVEGIAASFSSEG